MHTCFIFRAVFGLAYTCSIYSNSAGDAHLLAKPYNLCNGTGNFAFRYDIMSIKVYPNGFCSSDFIVQAVCNILASSRAECPLLSVLSSSHRASSPGLL